jgi:c-di-GMP-binding flagellar brake protein YcgR
LPDVPIIGKATSFSLLEDIIMAERRKSRRILSLESLPVRDKATGEVVGFVRDLSENGMMISGQGPFSVNRTYRLKMILLKPIMGTRQIELEAICKWKSKDPQHKAYKAGFSFSNLSAENELRILLVAAEYAVCSAEIEV